MSRIMKMFEKVKRSPNNANWKELETLLLYYGFTIRQKKHMVVHHKKIPTIVLTIPVHNNKVKPIYVKEIIKALQEVIEEDE